MQREIERVIYVPARLWQGCQGPLLRQVITRADIRREVERPSRRALFWSIVLNLTLSGLLLGLALS